MSQQPKYIALIVEAMNTQNLNNNKLSQITGRPIQLISEILNKKKSITPVTALELQLALEIDAYELLCYQAHYQLNQVKNVNALAITSRKAEMARINKGTQMLKERLPSHA